MNVLFFDKKIQSFIFDLLPDEKAKVLRTLELLEEFGQKLSMPHSKKILKDLFELRVYGKKQIRIIYTFKNNNAVLLSCFIKKTNKIPKKELLNALNRLKVLD
ncbi:type II toxin-antitoxin system RelE/ParE family toxin [Candidatus Gribaldobacteria bacterium]|nr:type II toxin-antitoxin system RelE/ParE family toxin [Candidatus Gribaldobacteria bacterium]